MRGKPGDVAGVGDPAGDSADDPTGGAGVEDAGAPHIRVRVLIEGRVQRVWFRDSTWHQADLLGVSGWVRNLPDGRVEAVYEGERQAVEEMIAWTNQGPPRAMVSGLQIHDEEPQGEEGFSIR